MIFLFFPDKFFQSFYPEIYKPAFMIFKVKIHLLFFSINFAYKNHSLNFNCPRTHLFPSLENYTTISLQKYTTFMQDEYFFSLYSGSAIIITTLIFCPRGIGQAL